jgi:HEAT repeat protein
LSVAEAHLDNATDLIRLLLADDNEYVRRRSLMVFAPLSPSEAETIAISNLSDEYEYTRMTALNVLYTVGSSQLDKYLDLLEFDPNEYVRQNVQELRLATGKI